MCVCLIEEGYDDFQIGVSSLWDDRALLPVGV